MTVAMANSVTMTDTGPANIDRQLTPISSATTYSADASSLRPIISVVMPTWNEGKNIGVLVTRLRAVLSELVPEFEILVIDGGSADETWSEAEKGGARCILQRRIGYGGALRDGMQAARGDFIITLDSDLSHPPELIRKLWPLRNEADVVIGSRFVEGGNSQAPKVRHMLSVILNTVFSNVLAVPVKDSSSGYRLYRRAVVRPDVYRPENFNILQEVIVRAFVDGWRVKEFPLNYEARVHGVSKVSFFKFAISYVPTLTRLWILRNSPTAADYELRAYDSRHALQRYWVRKRCSLITEMLGSAGKKIVDLGCGSSRFTALHPTAVAFDIRADKLRVLRNSNPLRVQGRIEELPYASESFDGAVVSEVLASVESTGNVLKEINRILKPGAIVVFSVTDSRRLNWRMIRFLYKRLPNMRKLDKSVDQKPEGAEKEFSRGELADLLAENGFRTLKYRYIFGAELILKAQKVASV